MARSRRPSGSTRVYDPAGAFRRSKKPVPADLQHEVERRAQALIDSILKPRYIQPPPKKNEINYLVDLYARWRGPFFYFCSRYCSPASPLARGAMKSASASVGAALAARQLLAQ